MLEGVEELFKGERGAILTIALLIMLALALIGVAALMTSTTELDISRNDRLATESFYVADGGTTLAPLIIEETIEQRALPNLPGVGIDSNFLSELMGYSTKNTPNQNPDITMTVNSKEMSVNVDRVSTQVLAGGAAEFAGGYEGIGQGAEAGGVGVFFRVDSQGSAIATSSAEVESYYRKVVNIASGD